MMIYKRRSKNRRVYLPPRDSSDDDLGGKQLLEDLLGLAVSEWKTIWFDEDAIDSAPEFLAPPPNDM